MGNAYRSDALAGQSALVTGASSGIGSEIAKFLAAAGANVGVNYAVNRSGADAVVRHIMDTGGNAIVIKADVRSEEDVAAMFRVMIETFGTVDILVNNAGVQQDAAFIDMTLEQWKQVIGINLTGAFLCAREAAREFIRRGMVPKRSRSLGKIIFISSVHEKIPWAGHVNYAASKGGVLQLMKSIAQELGPEKIRVNNIAPGAVRTRINKDAWETPEAEEKLLELIPYKRVGDVADIARAAVWLASDDAETCMAPACWSMAECLCIRVSRLEDEAFREHAFPYFSLQRQWHFQQESLRPSLLMYISLRFLNGTEKILSAALAPEDGFRGLDEKECNGSVCGRKKLFFPPEVTRFDTAITTGR